MTMSAVWGAEAPSTVPPPPRRTWRDRLPELVASIGATLVALALIGFLTSSWEHLTEIHKAMVLGAAAVGLTAVGLWADARDRPLEHVISLSWSTATLLVACAVTLAGFSSTDGMDRLVVGGAGAVAALHGGFLLARRRSSFLQQGALFAALLYAVGPPGTAISDRWGWPAVGDMIMDPVWGLLDPSHTVDTFAITGVGFLLVALTWMALGHALAGRARQLARGLGIASAALAALQLNVLTAQVGAVGALAIVIGFLIYGLVTDDALLVTAGAIGCLVAGVRVLAALFSGAALVTALVFAGGLVMIAWAFRAMRRRAARGQVPS